MRVLEGDAIGLVTELSSFFSKNGEAETRAVHVAIAIDQDVVRANVEAEVKGIIEVTGVVELCEAASATLFPQQPPRFAAQRLIHRITAVSAPKLLHLGTLIRSPSNPPFSHSAARLRARRSSQMAKRPDLDDDDDFSDLYKEYTGPPGSSARNQQESAKQSTRSHVSSDEEEERDPNAVPTDFTSREARVWEAKSKATEKNWKKRKEEEMICKICGESGHFTQGCPSTLGANRKTQDFFERVAAREKHVKALFTDKVKMRIETDIGCKIKMDEKFVIVSGKDRLILSKGVDAVHKVINEGKNKNSSGSHTHVLRSRSAEQSPRYGRSDSQRTYSSPKKPPQLQQRLGRPDKNLEDRVREDLQKISRNSPQARGKLLYSSVCVDSEVTSVDGSELIRLSPKNIYSCIRWYLCVVSLDKAAYGSDEGRSRSSQSRSPAPPPYNANSYSSYDGRRPSLGPYSSDGWNMERKGTEVPRDLNLEHSSFSRRLEELELDYQREAMNLAATRDQQLDEENYKHKEASRELGEDHMTKLTALRASHAKQWDEFLLMDARRREQKAAQQQLPSSGFGAYMRTSYSDYDSSSVKHHFPGDTFPMDPRGRHPNPMENFPQARPHEAYNDFQRQRPRDDYGRAYDRY
ncbi:hypothetical protein AKJ16_DCAP26092 [Drosera capensis]